MCLIPCLRCHLLAVCVHVLCRMIFQILFGHYKHSLYLFSFDRFDASARRFLDTRASFSNAYVKVWVVLPLSHLESYLARILWYSAVLRRFRLAISILTLSLWVMTRSLYQCNSNNTLALITSSFLWLSQLAAVQSSRRTDLTVPTNVCSRLIRSKVAVRLSQFDIVMLCWPLQYVARPPFSTVVWVMVLFLLSLALRRS